MIHVDEENAVERFRRKPRVVRLAEHDRDIVEILALDPLGEAVANLRDVVFGKHSATFSDDGRLAILIISSTRADVGDPQAWRHSGKTDDPVEFAHPVARVFGRESVADDRCDGPMRLWEFILLRLAAARKQKCGGTGHRDGDALIQRLRLRLSRR
jgi:hypothetical protein